MHKTAHGIALAGLGKRILRTETASGYVLSAISVLLED
jgi:16S rRNA U1498 N3-methylase RsmE